MSEESYAKLVAYYRDKEKDPVLFGRMLRDRLRIDDISQQALYRKTKISPGTIHHYISLLSLPDDMKKMVSRREMPFRVARALAGAGWEHAKLKQYARPFIDGRLSSHHVEKYVALAKKLPHLPPWQITESVKRDLQGPPPEDVIEEAMPKKREPEVIGPQHVRIKALELRATLQSCKWDDTPEALLAKSTLRDLASQVSKIE